MGWGSFISSVARVAGIVSKSPLLKFISPILSTISIVSMALTWLRKPDEPESNFDTTAENIAKGVLVNKTSANGQLPIIYGIRKVGGIISFLETSGTDNEFLYMILALSEGEIDDINSIYVNDNLITWSGDLADNTERTVGSGDSNYYKDSASLITVRPHYGTDTQTYDTLVGGLTSWTSNHRLRGISYLALKFTWNQDAFGSIPTVHAIVKGRKVYNPNLDGSITGGSGSHRADTSSTWEYSDNPVYQLLDYLRNTRFGMGIANGYFDTNFADWQTAGDICDVNITPYSGADEIDLIDSHTVIDTSQKCINNVQNFLTGCRGYLNYTAGNYKVTVETSGSASITLTEDNIIGGIGISSKNKNERFNRVITTFINPSKNYQVDEAQFPPVDDSAQASADQHATMKTADGGILLEGRFDFPSITNPYQAQEMAEIILRRSRSSLDVSLTADGTAMDLAVGDIVNITHATPSFSAKAFRVLSVTLNPDSTTSLQLTEHQDSYYSFGTQIVAATIPDTNLPSPFSVSAPASLTLTDSLVEYSDGVVITKLEILVGASTNKFAQYYQVEAKLSTDSDYVVLGKGTQLNYEMLNVIDTETYNVRAKAINSLGVSSTYTTGNRVIVGGSEPPSNIADFSIEMHGSNQMRLTWTPPTASTDLDIAYYEIRYQNVTSGALWNNSTNLIRVTRRKSDNAIVNSRTGAFLIKAIDKTGNESNDETIIYTNISNVFNYTDITTTTETLSLATSAAQMDSTYPLCIKEDSSGDTVIALDTITDFDDTVGNFDSPSGDFELGGTDATSNPAYSTANRDNLGYYNFANSISLSAIFDGTVQPTLTLDNEDPYDQFDSGRGVSFFDDAKAPFDGSEPSHAFHKIQIAVSNTSLGDATTYQDISSSATHKFRYAKFRLRLTNDDYKTSSKITGLSVKLSLEDRTVSGADIVSGTGTKAVTFSNAFYASPSLGIAAQNMATGDTYTISSKSVTGFSIAFINSSGSGVSRTFDYVAKGYGLTS
tara:strand:+ start:1091 stop:4105 length:3015 start_codon:yes stop_codon:yes gene_type:complete